MKYHSLFLSKITKDVPKLSSTAVVIGDLRVKYIVGSFTKPRMCTFLPNPVFNMATITTVKRTRSQNLVCYSQ